MKLTQASRYAIRALVLMGAKGEKGYMTSEHIAKVADISEMFLLKALKPLVTAGLLNSLKGPGGGYRLAKPIKDISLLQVVEAVDGPIRGELTFQGSNGSGALDNQLQTICDDLAQRYRGHLGKVRLTELLKVR